jgi:alcohol dehydrogenase class IV
LRFQSVGETQQAEKMRGKGSDVVIGVGAGSYQTEHKASYI